MYSLKFLRQLAILALLFLAESSYAAVSAPAFVIDGKNGSFVSSDVEFRYTLRNKYGIVTDNIPLGEDYSLSINLLPRAADTKKAADIIVLYSYSPEGGATSWSVAGADGKWVAWDGTVSNLKFAAQVPNLPTIMPGQTREVYHNGGGLEIAVSAPFPAHLKTSGEINMYAGYRLTDGTIVFSSAPVKLKAALNDDDDDFLLNLIPMIATATTSQVNITTGTPGVKVDGNKVTVTMPTGEKEFIIGKMELTPCSKIEMANSEGEICSIFGCMNYTLCTSCVPVLKVAPQELQVYAKAVIPDFSKIDLGKIAEKAVIDSVMEPVNDMVTHFSGGTTACAAAAATSGVVAAVGSFGSGAVPAFLAVWNPCENLVISNMEKEMTALPSKIAENLAEKFTTEFFFNAVLGDFKAELGYRSVCNW